MAKIKTGISIDDWVFDEILSKASNRSALIQEALIKLHFEKQKLNKGTREKDSNNAPVVQSLFSHDKIQAAALGMQVEHNDSHMITNFANDANLHPTLIIEGTGIGSY